MSVADPEGASHTVSRLAARKTNRASAVTHGFIRRTLVPPQSTSSFPNPTVSDFL